MKEYEKCLVCPRSCGANRNNNQTGYCKETSSLRIARASLHMWEEPCISGTNGSGTIFFTGCNLKCIFCQNGPIALGETGKEISVEKLSEIMLSLQDKKAHNINLVTASHFIPSVSKAIIHAKDNGLTIPILYNCGGYESTNSLKMLDGLVDIYLPDFKYFSSTLSKDFSNAPDYFETSKVSLKEMVRQAPKCTFDSNEMITSGVIVRHLILPGHTKDSMEVIRYLFDTYGNDIFVSIMNQYTPMPWIKEYTKFPELQRKVTKKEYDKVIDFAISLGLTNAFIQEGETAKESFIPPFDLSGF